MTEGTAPQMSANDVITSLIAESAKKLEETLNGDVLSYKGPMMQPIDEMIRDALEARKTKKDKLIFVLETEGGYLDVVVRIVDTIRHHYPSCVEFIVPNYAFSAGTVLVLSGDEIYMDYFSVLGPTDPQDEVDGRLIPALGYIERYDELIRKANKGNISLAEITLLVQGFDQGRLKMYEHARELAKSLLKEWLPKYKFKNWKETETRKLPVDDKKRQRRAAEIAQQLSNTKKWHSHGRGICKDILEHDLNLKIKDFGADPDLNSAIRNYNGLLVDFAGKMGYSTFLYTPNRLTVPFQYQQGV